MPGSEICARCSSSMQIATMVMDVRPPRAGKFQKAWRRIVPARRAYLGVRDGLQSTAGPAARRAAAELSSMCPTIAPWSMTWRSAVPGWAHWYAGQLWRARLFFIGYIALLLPGLLFIGTSLGGILLGLAFSVHTSAAFDTYCQYQPSRSFRSLMSSSILVTIALVIAVYLPAMYLMSCVASVRTITLTAAPLQQGDVLLMNQSAHWGEFPRVGQIVVYRLPDRVIEIAIGNHGRQVYHYTGERVDRVLAIGGDRVELKSGILRVNGMISPYAPLNVASLPKQMAFVVPADCVLILPTTTPNLGPGSDVSLWQSLACIPRTDVTGSVYLRLQPLSRFWIMR